MEQVTCYAGHSMEYWIRFGIQQLPLWIALVAALFIIIRASRSMKKNLEMQQFYKVATIVSAQKQEASIVLLTEMRDLLKHRTSQA